MSKRYLLSLRLTREVEESFWGWAAPQILKRSQENGVFGIWTRTCPRNATPHLTERTPRKILSGDEYLPTGYKIHGLAYELSAEGRSGTLATAYKLLSSSSCSCAR
jgi:hypothetical protein